MEHELSKIHTYNKSRIISSLFALFLNYVLEV